MWPSKTIDLGRYIPDQDGLWVEMTRNRLRLHILPKIMTVPESTFDWSISTHLHSHVVHVNKNLGRQAERSIIHCAVWRLLVENMER